MKKLTLSQAKFRRLVEKAGFNIKSVYPIASGGCFVECEGRKETTPFMIRVKPQYVLNLDVESGVSIEMSDSEVQIPHLNIIKEGVKHMIVQIVTEGLILIDNEGVTHYKYVVYGDGDEDDDDDEEDEYYHNPAKELDKEVKELEREILHTRKYRNNKTIEEKESPPEEEPKEKESPTKEETLTEDNENSVESITIGEEAPENDKPPKDEETHEEEKTPESDELTQEENDTDILELMGSNDPDDKPEEEPDDEPDDDGDESETDVLDELELDDEELLPNAVLKLDEVGTSYVCVDLSQLIQNVNRIEDEVIEDYRHIETNEFTIREMRIQNIRDETTNFLEELSSCIRRARDKEVDLNFTLSKMRKTMNYLQATYAKISQNPQKHSLSIEKARVTIHKGEYSMHEVRTEILSVKGHIDEVLSNCLGSIRELTKMCD